ncbi:pyruvate dehydrogenase complex E1 component subunit beta [Candidatus Karelsulcia muelleri]|uniref:pyruvate dehydrogenase complex E1 component subunit beta n=1 Tax=Candidatus Karelsulcia muelleri TaxID=336810 RepID=UPI0023634940|nr:pyruvate dehydrogenase complex E1 component subunit beta [Candidatus Karelsulcia muelleri]WDE42236.1 pyruvate dehydrogenase complex E1 component subunit beta [Candidatus Karelsulcia muelleri]WDR79083.1 pyruvate dehydrogenase complex E1 component subunit beta [Candidatus Karelsulcia muelleri]
MKTISFREAIKEAMSEEMRRDKSIYLIGEEVGAYNGAYKASKGMLSEFGKKRVIDTPISELGFSGLGIGSALNGCRPIIEFMTFNFSLVAIDQIINNAAKIRQMSGGQWEIPIVFRGPTGFAGQLGATHSQSLENWYAHCPGLKVVVPSNAYDAKGLLKSAIKDNDVIIFLESEIMYGDQMNIPNKEYYLPLGKASIKRTGSDITLVSFGKILKLALKASKELEKANINLEIIDLKTIRPLDYKTILKSVKKTNRLIILEEAWPFGSISSEITYLVQKYAFDYLDAPIKRITLEDTPAPYAKNLLKIWYPSKEKIITYAKNLLSKK